MKKLKQEENQVKILFAGTILVLLCVVLPLFLIARYNFQSVDDIGYAVSAENVWQETHSVWRVFARQAAYAKEYWEIWQGTFAAEWFTTSMMGIFIKDAYYMGTYLSLGGFVLSELLLFMVLLKKVLGADTFRAGITAISVLCLQILLVPVPAEAYFWFCGAVLYTVSYNEAILLCTLLVLLYQNRGKVWQKCLLMAGICLLSLLVAGGTYVTLMGMLLVYFFLVVLYWYRKNPNRWLATAGLLLYLAVAGLNVLAPGNQKRLTSAGAEQMSAIGAILRSLWEAALYIAKNTMLPSVILALLFVPLFLKIVKKKNYQYPLPLLVTLISFGVFAAQFTPNLYTLGITGAGRIQNVYRWTFYIWLYGNELYWIGWLVRKKKVYESNTNTTAGYLLPGWVLGAVLLALALYVWGGDTLSSVSAAYSLHRGEAQSYYAEYQERLAVLEDETVTDAVFKPYTFIPYVLYFGDITDKPEDWVNQSVANYYGKNSVVLQK